MNDTNIFEDIKLSVKIGFGVGEFSIIYVGGLFKRAEYLPVGDPLTQAFQCEGHAEGGGIVIISSKVYQLVHSYFETI